MPKATILAPTRRAHGIAAVAALALFGGATPARVADDGAAASFARDVSILASDDMEGRGLGTRGLEKAAEWIEARLKALHLEPAFGPSYRQPFDVKVGVTLEPGNSLSGVAMADWTPMGFSSSGEFHGEIAFVGYGIEAAPLDYRELSGVDLKGKIALMLRYEPQEKDEASRFDGRRPSRWSAPRYKVLQARERGAVGGRLRDRADAGRGQRQAAGSDERRPGEPGGDSRDPGQDVRRAEVADAGRDFPGRLSESRGRGRQTAIRRLDGRADRRQGRPLRGLCKGGQRRRHAARPRRAGQGRRRHRRSLRSPGMRAARAR